jgi:hypothetical protein
MLSKIRGSVFLFSVLIFPLVCFSQIAETPVPIKDVFEMIAQLVNNWRSLSTLGLISSVIVLVMQILKTEIMGGLLLKASPFLKRLLITVFGQVAGVIVAVSGGLTWVEAIVTGLITSGGAVAIYEAIKPFFSKKLKD